MKHTRLLLALATLLLILAAACGQPPRVLYAPPQAAFKVIGMISGQGANEAGAMAHALEQAERIEAHAIVVVGRRPLGRSMIVTCRAIRYIGPPPEQ